MLCHKLISCSEIAANNKNFKINLINLQSIFVLELLCSASIVWVFISFKIDTIPQKGANAENLDDWFSETIILPWHDIYTVSCYQCLECYPSFCHHPPLFVDPRENNIILKFYSQPMYLSVCMKFQSKYSCYSSFIDLMWIDRDLIRMEPGFHQW